MQRPVFVSPDEEENSCVVDEGTRMDLSIENEDVRESLYPFARLTSPTCHNLFTIIISRKVQ